jgi:hypothetical protein
MPIKIYSNSEIAGFLTEELTLESSSELARRLGVSRQSVSNYSGKNKIDINNKIISELIGLIEKERR